MEVVPSAPSSKAIVIPPMRTVKANMAEKAKTSRTASFDTTERPMRTGEIR